MRILLTRATLFLWLVINPLAAGIGFTCTWTYLQNLWGIADTPLLRQARSLLAILIGATSIVMHFHEGYKIRLIRDQRT